MGDLAIAGPDRIKSRSLLCDLTMMDQFIRKASRTKDVWNAKDVLDFVPVFRNLGENGTRKPLKIICNLKHRLQVHLLIRT